MTSERRSHARRVTTVARPLFTGYLFVRLGAKPWDWRPILRTPGVRDLMRTGDELICLDHAFIAALKEREIEGAIVAPPKPHGAGDKRCLMASSQALSGWTRMRVS